MQTVPKICAAFRHSFAFGDHAQMEWSIMTVFMSMQHSLPM